MHPILLTARGECQVLKVHVFSFDFHHRLIGRTTDALKSIGMVVVQVSWILILGVWATLGWRTEWTWRGFAFLFITAAVARVEQQVFLIMAVSLRWLTSMPPMQQAAADQRLAGLSCLCQT